MTEALFSYGTLQLLNVQIANYGRALEGEPDALIGYRIEDLVVGDPDVVAISGKEVHSIARHTGNAGDRIEGTVLELTEHELAATDDYEVEPYRRIEVTLESGRAAWVYVGPPLPG